MLALKQYPDGATTDEVVQRVPKVSPAHVAVSLRRIVQKGFATAEPLPGGGLTGRPPFLYRSAGPVSTELRFEIDEFLGIYINTPEAAQLLLAALEAHRRAASLD